MVFCSSEKAEKQSKLSSLIYSAACSKLTHDCKLTPEQEGELQGMVEIILKNYRPDIMIEFEASGRIKNLRVHAESLKCDEYEHVFGGHYGSILAWVMRITIDMLKITHDLESADSQLPEAMKAALKTKQFNLVGDYTETIHAEARIVEALSIGSRSESAQYIGISKLCCAHCNLLVENCAGFGHAYESVPFVFARGGAGTCWEWEFPAGIADSGPMLLAFMGGVESPLGRLFRALDDEQRIAALHIVQSIKTLKGKQLKRLGLDVHATYGRQAQNALAAPSTSLPAVVFYNPDMPVADDVAELNVHDPRYEGKEESL